MDEEPNLDPDERPFCDDAGEDAVEEDEDFINEDPQDWVDPFWLEQHRAKATKGAKDVEGKHRESGDAQQPISTTELDEELTCYAGRLRKLQQIQTIAKSDLGGHLGAQLSQVVDRATKDLGKRFKACARSNPTASALAGEHCRRRSNLPQEKT